MIKDKLQKLVDKQVEDRNNAGEVSVSAEDMDKLKKEMSPDWWFIRKYFPAEDISKVGKQ